MRSSRNNRVNLYELNWSVNSCTSKAINILLCAVNIRHSTIICYKLIKWLRDKLWLRESSKKKKKKEEKFICKKVVSIIHFNKLTASMRVDKSKRLLKWHCIGKVDVCWCHHVPSPRRKSSINLGLHLFMNDRNVLR